MEDCFRKYDIVTQTYNASGQKSIPDNCNGYTVVNTGADTVEVDNIVLFPGTVGSIQGDSFTVGGNRNEILQRSNITIMFRALTGPAVTVTYKYYV